MAETNGNEPHRNEPTLLNIEDDMRQSYLDYAMSVNIGRALPEIRDGLKPVHRRILYAMFREGLLANRRYSKCAGVVGEVLKNYHPHGDMSVYDSLVRMAQPFSLRYPLIDGQGNFGSIDGDPPAAYRYTECKLTRLAERMLADIDKDTVDFVPNFDGSHQEPEILPAQISEPAGQRLRRHRGRHGDQHSAAQSRRGLRRAPRADQEPRASRTRRFSTSSRAPIFRPADSCSGTAGDSHRPT